MGDSPIIHFECYRLSTLDQFREGLRFYLIGFNGSEHRPNQLRPITFRMDSQVALPIVPFVENQIDAFSKLTAPLRGASFLWRISHPSDICGLKTYTF
jgi:hypothetical protein